MPGDSQNAKALRAVDQLADARASELAEIKEIEKQFGVSVKSKRKCVNAWMRERMNK